MKVFGHRGFSGEYPENTMLAFSEGLWRLVARGSSLMYS